MKKIAVLLMLLLAVAVRCAYAHSPSDMKITFNPATKVLTVVIMHDVSRTVNHYTKRVDIHLNRKEIINDVFSRQDNDFSQTVTYTIKDAKPGDTITVTALCNIIGRIKRKITVE